MASSMHLLDEVLVDEHRLCEIWSRLSGWIEHMYIKHLTTRASSMFVVFLCSSSKYHEKHKDIEIVIVIVTTFYDHSCELVSFT